MGKYSKNKHEDDPIVCPKCKRKNAPVESDEFSPSCWDCNTFLNTTPVSTGDEVIVDIEDIHENGSGVGKTDSGYVVLVEGILPPARAKIEVTKVNPNYSEGEVVEELEAVEEEQSDKDEEEDQSLGSRENYWGN